MQGIVRVAGDPRSPKPLAWPPVSPTRRSWQNSESAKMNLFPQWQCEGTGCRWVAVGERYFAWYL